MATIDPDQERKRLVEHYSLQLEGEIESVAGQAYDLTAVAREALKGELARRGLSVELAENPSGDEIELRELVIVGKFRDLPDALLAKGSLHSAGIESFLLDDNVVRLDWFWSNLLGGIKLEVDPENVGPAKEILDQPIPESIDVTGVGEYAQPRCPKCGSLEINFHELEPIAYVSAYFNVPIPLERKAWRCHSCYAQWEDAAPDGDQASHSS
jgi:hypothetical protein